VHTQPSDEALQEAGRAAAQSLVDDPPTVLPPLAMMKTIGSPTVDHYLHNMQLYVADLIAEARLQTDARILDIGSGSGRIATAFTRYLANAGSYTGIDVWDEGVQWCTSHITAAHPNFTFHHVRAANNYYYAADSGQANDFDLSFLPTHGFDGIFALSVFTHLRLVDARQYFALINRLLAREGRAYLTFFVIDEDSHRFVRETGQHTALAPAGDGMWYAYEKQWFFSGYEEPLLMALFDEHGLDVCKRSPGLWAKKPGARLWQDWFLVRRRS
jgi:cyclopropane fatty-acyl-phospholipid synthase-like methyltransferase